MTKKDFIAIADTLRAVFQSAGMTKDDKQAITGAFVAMLLKQNPRFDADKFAQAVYKV
jgi:hypothetical protein